jgi:parvulin-like peptidyl-prolyl isomerase
VLRAYRTAASARRSLRPASLVAAGLLAVTLSACGTPRAGAAATVGDDRITTSELDAVVQRSLADPSAEQTVGADKPGFERSVLARMIQHLVLEKAAKDTGVSVDGATVDAAFDTFSAQLGGEEALRSEALKAGIAPQDLRGAIADAALRDAIADALTASIVIPPAVLAQQYQADIAQYDRVHSAHILVGTLAQARQVLNQVNADPESFPQLAAQLSLDTSNKAKGGDLGFQGRGALEKPFEDAIFAAKPGTFVLAKTSFGFHVIHVIERKTVPLAQATTQLRRSLLGPQRADALTALLDKTAKALKVHVNPRFGTWDPATEGVIASVLCPDTAISSPSPRPDDSGGAAPTPEASPDC